MKTVGPVGQNLQLVKEADRRRDRLGRGLNAAIPKLETGFTSALLLPTGNKEQT